MHSKNICHRDLKAENILICRGPNGEIIGKLSDLGEAKELSVDATRNTAVGTDLYMAPEISDRVPYTTVADIFSLGVMFCYVFVRKMPWLNRNEYASCKIVIDLDSCCFKEVIEGCLKEKAGERPTTTQVLDNIHVHLINEACKAYKNRPDEDD